MGSSGGAGSPGHAQNGNNSKSERGAAMGSAASPAEIQLQLRLSEPQCVQAWRGQAAGEAGAAQAGADPQGTRRAASTPTSGLAELLWGLLVAEGVSGPAKCRPAPFCTRPTPGAAFCAACLAFVCFHLRLAGLATYICTPAVAALNYGGGGQWTSQVPASAVLQSQVWPPEVLEPGRRGKPCASAFLQQAVLSAGAGAAASGAVSKVDCCAARAQLVLVCVLQPAQMSCLAAWLGHCGCSRLLCDSPLAVMLSKQMVAGTREGNTRQRTQRRSSASATSSRCSTRSRPRSST